MADPGALEGAAGHGHHDPELIVALLDRDLADAERASAEARIAACHACASLYEDLVALAGATIELATPGRPRDFTVTPQVAAALARTAAGEPSPAPTRLSGEMADSRSTHADHDRLLIANLVDRSPGDAERARGDEQMAACRDCALLYDDLVAL
ncbi:MAG TPA: hypothetical protein VFW02_10335, partial [Candidatus Limnocylindrales bacterium]|nr:hypothetical protein [Candidatus Limnocylindrales bacterium]